MKKGLFAGLDVSTQGAKIVVIDAGAREVAHVGAVNYDEDLPVFQTKNGVVKGLGEGASESDPRMWIDAVEKLFGNLGRSGVQVKDILCLSVSGQQHGLVALDREGRLTRPRAKLWNDFSTLEECRLLTDKAGGLEAMIGEVGNSQRTGYTAAKIFHMFRHEREAYDRTATFFLVHNFINWYLTGAWSGGARVMEPGDTSGMALWNPGTGRWSRKVIEVIDPGLMDKLPPVGPSTETIGKISRALTEKYGFSPDCRIDAGSGDNMYSAIGTGNVAPGIVTVSLGTSGTAYTVMDEPFIDPTGEIAAFCDSTGRHLPLLCVSNLANGYNELLRVRDLTHEDFSKIILKTPPGNSGRLLIPWYTGERTPDVPLAAPIYFGFAPGDFSTNILCRAVLEGHILNLYDGFRRMPITPNEIRLTGGFCRSECWCQTIADIFEADAVPVEGEGAALGAALHAAWVYFSETGDKFDWSDLTGTFIVLDENRRKKPLPEHLNIYRIQKKLFQALSSRVRGQAGDDPFALRAQMLSLSVAK